METTQGKSIIEVDDYLTRRILTTSPTSHKHFTDGRKGRNSEVREGNVLIIEILLPKIGVYR